MSGAWDTVFEPFLTRLSATKDSLSESRWWKKLTEDQQNEIVSTVTDLAETCGKKFDALGLSTLVLDDIVRKTTKTIVIDGRSEEIVEYGFLVQSLDDAYQTWWKAISPADATAPAANATPLEFIKATTKGPVATMIRALLGPIGPTYTWLGRPTIARPASARWTMFTGKVFTGDTAANILSKLRSSTEIRAAVEAYGEPQMDLYAGRIQLVFENLAGGKLEDLSDSAAATILGRLDKRLAEGKAVPNFQELIEILIIGMKNAEDELDLVGGSLENSPLSLDSLLEVPGIASFFLDVVTRSGYGTGSLFEIRLLGDRFFKMITEEGYTDPARYLMLQVPMDDSLKGPDIGWLTKDGTRFILMQAKSYKNLNVLTRDVKNNELIRQLTSDLKRLNEQAFKIETSPGVYVQISETIEWRVDWRRISESSFATDKELDDAKAALYAMALDVNKKLETVESRTLFGLPSPDPRIKINLELDGET